MECIQAFDGAGEIVHADTGREVLIVAQEQQIWRDVSDGLHEIFLVPQSHIHIGTLGANGMETFCFAVNRSRPLECGNIAVPCHDDHRATAPTRFVDHEHVTRVEQIECSTHHDKAPGSWSREHRGSLARLKVDGVDAFLVQYVEARVLWVDIEIFELADLLRVQDILLEVQ